MGGGEGARRLVVADRRWRWRVRPDGPAYPGHLLVRVWLDGEGGRAARLEVRARFDDPWLNFGEMITTPPERRDQIFAVSPVTPRVVAAMIEQALAQGWDERERGTTRAAEWHDGALRMLVSER